jgi:hypothetical protein
MAEEGVCCTNGADATLILLRLFWKGNLPARTVSFSNVPSEVVSRRTVGFVGIRPILTASAARAAASFSNVDTDRMDPSLMAVKIPGWGTISVITVL